MGLVYTTNEKVTVNNAAFRRAVDILVQGDLNGNGLEANLSAGDIGRGISVTNFGVVLGISSVISN